MINIEIDGKKIECEYGKTIMEVANINGITIPSLCNHPDLSVKASCRICAVEIEGEKSLLAACSTLVKDGMKITTNSTSVKTARKTNLELIFAQHNEECADCVWRYNCQLLDLAKEFKIEINRYADRKKNYPIYQFGPAINFESGKCIDCRNCVEACEKQGVGFLEVEKKGNFLDIVPSKDKKKDCVYCGQCITHCPAGAFESVGEFDPPSPVGFGGQGETVVFQFAPSIRASIGEEFGLAAGSIVTGQLVSAIKKLGANYVFDTSTGADFTTYEEAEELKERLENGGALPMLTSCCPAWVKYVEFYHPELIPNLTTARSPHIMLGGIIKTYWARNNNVDPKNIVNVSVLPCTSKKYEISRDEMKIDGISPVDYALTTRELAYLLKNKKIDLPKLSPVEADNPFGDPSGAGVIYGASGGVMESALRTAYYKITGHELPKIDFEDARGMDGIKTAKVNIKGRDVRIAIINGLGNAISVLENIKSFDYIEVMACPGGCIGGGGQPVPTSPEIRKKRAEALYKIDKDKKARSAHNNPDLIKYYKEVEEKEAHKVLHTKFSKDKGIYYRVL